MRYLILLALFFGLTANAEFKVLIVDTGLSLEREDLTKYVYSKYKDNYSDKHGHGTHIASIILKNACPSVKIIPCMFYYPGVKNPVKNEVKCLKLGLKHKVDLVNMSLNGKKSFKIEVDVLKEYEKLKIPVHVALGNQGEESRITLPNHPSKYELNKNKKAGTIIPTYPADLELTNIVKIGALEGRGFASYSNIRNKAKYFNGTIKGATLVKGGKDYEMSGTSQSTAYYTGLKVKEYCDNQK